MFYSQLILAKKGPLGRVWLAAHWDKMSKSAVLQTDVEKSVGMCLYNSMILCPAFTAALACPAIVTTCAHLAMPGHWSIT